MHASEQGVPKELEEEMPAMWRSLPLNQVDFLEQDVLKRFDETCFITFKSEKVRYTEKGS